MGTPLHNPYVIDRVCSTEGFVSKHLDRLGKKTTREKIGKTIAKYTKLESNAAAWKRMSKEPRYTTDIDKACVQDNNEVYALLYAPTPRTILSCHVIGMGKDKQGHLNLNVTVYHCGDEGELKYYTTLRKGDKLRNMLFDTRRHPRAQRPWAQRPWAPGQAFFCR